MASHTAGVPCGYGSKLFFVRYWLRGYYTLGLLVSGSWDGKPFQHNLCSLLYASTLVLLDSIEYVYY